MAKTCLITGASSGMGKSTTLHYAANGWLVYAVARSADKLAELAENHENIKPVSLDVTDSVALATWTAALPTGQKFDAVILNAGTCEYVDVDDLDLAAFERTFAVNVQGVVCCTRYLLPLLNKGHHPTLAIVSSMSHFFPFTRAEAYGASKAAVAYFTDSLRVDLADTDINVCLIEPGFIDTPLTRKNDFEMPFLMAPEVAAKRIFDGINAAKSRLRFPRRLSFSLKLLNLLPYTLRNKLAARMRKQ
ncbi:SDR family NAD(P)-dependent oxidoreductase [Arsukibacterium indicum]|uniref:SDR family NAD(P)-dependent oxidoreductase n=1 Tax=Arsukibacterium indicum TaxID=2848612 RepID=A0ABS6MJ56_9GAMM|nr:SDR family NAD(P)-dependent oxidoreductase [Arsukibacterium indicum]MBV2128785.1 SDR family NAD(P)-dependent oxidoreductase [Arsukibacterium indicum]